VYSYTYIAVGNNSNPDLDRKYWSDFDSTDYNIDQCCIQWYWRQEFVRMLIQNLHQSETYYYCYCYYSNIHDFDYEAPNHSLQLWIHYWMTKEIILWCYNGRKRKDRTFLKMERMIMILFEKENKQEIRYKIL